MNLMITEFCGLGNSVLLSNIFFITSNKNIILIGNDKYGGLSIHRDNSYLKKIINIKKNNLYSIIRNIKIQDCIIIPFTSNPPIFFLIALIVFSKEKIITSKKFIKDMNFFKLKIIKLILVIKKMINKNFDIKEIDYLDDENEREINKKFIEGLNLKDEQLNVEFKFIYNENSDILTNHELEKNKYFVIQPYANNGNKSAKIWPESMFVSLIQLLKKNFSSYKIVLVGDKNDLKNSKNKFSYNQVVNLIGKTDLDDLISLLKHSKYNICHDSSVLHISDILNKENISIFGPTNFKKNKPYSTKSKTLYKNYFCSPCVGWSENYRRNIDEVEALQICKYNHKCMKDINPEDILNIIFEIN